MVRDLPDGDFQRFWRRLQRIGLNAYEARSYLVLVGHPRFKALELAARAHVPRQKIYEVLDSLVEKGFAQVIQEKTKLFSAVEPDLAIPAYLHRRGLQLSQELAEQAQVGGGLANELKAAYSEGQTGKGTLDYLRIVGDPVQTASQYRRMLGDVQREYLELARPPYAVDPLDEQLVRQARMRGVRCRILIEGSLDEEHRHKFAEYSMTGVEVRQTESLPLKLALFDGTHGLIALLDPVVTKPAWTSIVFEHSGFAQAMKGLFEDHWRRAQEPARRAG
jgi:sugar-specific transcriptional regulator TrmB